MPPAPGLRAARGERFPCGGDGSGAGATVPVRVRRGRSRSSPRPSRLPPPSLQRRNPPSLVPLGLRSRPAAPVPFDDAVRFRPRPLGRRGRPKGTRGHPLLERSRELGGGRARGRFVPLPAHPGAAPRVSACAGHASPPGPRAQPRHRTRQSRPARGERPRTLPQALHFVRAGETHPSPEALAARPLHGSVRASGWLVARFSAPPKGTTPGGKRAGPSLVPRAPDGAHRRMGAVRVRRGGARSSPHPRPDPPRRRRPVP